MRNRLLSHSVICACLVSLSLFVAARAHAIGSDTTVGFGEADHGSDYRADDRIGHDGRLYGEVAPEMTVPLTPKVSIFVQGRQNAAGSTFFAGSSAGFYGPDVEQRRLGLTTAMSFLGGIDFRTSSMGRYRLTGSTELLDPSVLPTAAEYPGAHGGGEDAGRRYSFSLALDGSGFSKLPGLRYRLALSRTPGRTGVAAPETGFAAGLKYGVNLGWGISVTPLARLDFYDGAGGVAGTDKLVRTLEGRIGWKTWDLGMTWTGNETRSADGAVTVDSVTRLSSRYEFPFGLWVDAGWTVTRSAGERAHAITSTLGYTYRF